MYSTASLTRVIFSASSSGISMPNSSSNAMTSSTVSSESAPRSSTKEASGVTSSSSTPSCSTMMLFTLSATAIQSSRLPGPIRAGLHVHAAVDREYLSCNIRCLVRREEANRRRNVVRGSDPPQRNPRLPLVLRILGDDPCHVRFDQAWRDDVDRHAARANLLRDGLREC